MASSNDLPRLKGDALVVLLTLSGGPLHGYAIMLQAEERSGGDVRLQTGALYRTIKRLLDERLVEECDRPAGADGDDDRRRYYRLTRRGKEALAAEGERLERLSREIRHATAGKRIPQT
jgi:DNA-binding PadR family transcriptional regulator